jgi:hypothetical protein
MRKEEETQLTEGEKRLLKFVRRNRKIFQKMAKQIK